MLLFLQSASTEHRRVIDSRNCTIYEPVRGAKDVSDNLPLAYRRLFRATLAHIPQFPRTPTKQKKLHAAVARKKPP